MRIEEMTREESLELLKRVRLGHLACACDGQPYVTPVYFVCESEYLYSYSTRGKKIDWMRANPLVCVEAEEFKAQTWKTVIVYGRYEELPDEPNFTPLRHHAHTLLQRHKRWWEPGFAKTMIGGQERPLESVFFRIQIADISGHRAV